MKKFIILREYFYFYYNNLTLTRNALLDKKRGKHLNYIVIINFLILIILIVLSKLCIIFSLFNMTTKLCVAIERKTWTSKYPMCVGFLITKKTIDNNKALRC